MFVDRPLKVILHKREISVLFTQAFHQTLKWHSLQSGALMETPAEKNMYILLMNCCSLFPT